jgi:hypothetical protein
MRVGVQEFRLDVEDAVDIKGVATENFVERDLGTFGALQHGTIDPRPRAIRPPPSANASGSSPRCRPGTQKKLALLELLAPLV